MMMCRWAIFLNPISLTRIELQKKYKYGIHSKKIGAVYSLELN